jgi:hypothetical protein
MHPFSLIRSKRKKKHSIADELGLKIEMGCLTTVTIDPSIELPLVCFGDGSDFKYIETKGDINIKTNTMKLLQQGKHGHYSVIQINKKQIDNSYNGILGDDKSWRTRSSYLGMQMDNSGVTRHLYKKKKDARRATLLGIILFERSNMDGME